MIKTLFSSIKRRLSLDIGLVTFNQLTIFVALTIICPVHGFASEGFDSSSERLPPLIKKAWDSTFLFLYSNENQYGIGTAFLTGLDENYLYFTTAYHVTRDRCERDNTCPKIQLFQMGSFDTVQDGKLLFISGKGLTFDQVELYRQTMKPDYALLRVKIPSSLDRSKLPKPMKIANSTLHIGDRIYTIGFPATPDRTCNKHIDIEDQSKILKRWSSGIYTGRLRSDDNHDQNTQIWLGATTDALAGNSGGPALNEFGEVIGLITRAAATNNNGYCYDGNEQPDLLSEHSYIVDLR
jgi:hypothetical protein